MKAKLHILLKRILSHSSPTSTKHEPYHIIHCMHLASVLLWYSLSAAEESDMFDGTLCPESLPSSCCGVGSISNTLYPDKAKLMHREGGQTRINRLLTMVLHY